MLKKLPAECIAPLRLNEITLHGIGSYLRPATLEIRPLTILCGPNGSGKSTWITTLTLLQQAAINGDFTPWGVLKAAQTAGIELRNADTCQRDTDAAPVEPDWADPLGPRWSIGLSWTVIKKTNVGAPAARVLPRIPEGLIALMSRGVLHQSEDVHVRFTLPWQGATPSSCQPSAIRISMHGEALELRVLSTAEDVQWTILVGQDDLPLKKVASGKNLDDSAPSTLVSRMCALGMVWQGAFFHISAIRHVVTEKESWLNDWAAFQTAWRDLSRPRYVGSHGEHTHLLRTAFFFNALLDPRPNRPYLCVNPKAIEAHMAGRMSFLVGEPTAWQLIYRINRPAWDAIVKFFIKHQGKFPTECLRLLDLATTMVAAARTQQFDELASLWRRPDVPRDGITVGREGVEGVNWTLSDFWPIHPTTKPGKTIHIGGIEATSEEPLDGPGFQLAPVDNTPQGKLRARLGRLFETLDKTFGDFSETPAIVDYYLQHPEGSERQDVPPFIRFLHSLPASGRHPDDEAYLQAWTRMSYGAQTWCHAGSLRFDTFVTFWLKRLLGIKGTTPNYFIDFSDWWPADAGTPAGFLAGEGLEDTAMGDVPEMIPASFENGFLTGNPSCFSSGFHQVAPILVQFGLMKMNELCAVENPEVHLHPGLQLRFAEFFIENARINKFALVETHSDLIIRRVYRALREETIRQSWVGIYFVREETMATATQGESDTRTSAIELLKLNKQGQIANWPKGFLDDDEQESAALMRVMYGKQTDQEGADGSGSTDD